MIKLHKRLDLSEKTKWRIFRLFNNPNFVAKNKIIQIVNHLDYINSTMNHELDEQDKKNFVVMTKALDDIRSQNIKDIYPNIYKDWEKEFNEHWFSNRIRP